jgi:hypothetical protein
MPGQHITGVLHDLTKISLFECVTREGTGNARQGEESYYYATILPNFVVYGGRHLAPDEKTILEARFVVDDATRLFYDFDAFGTLLDARPFIEKIVNANALPRTIEIGPHPEIQYFTGKTEIFSADTDLGRISASHSPTRSLGGPDGVYLKNTIFVSIAFAEPLTFEESIVSVSTLLGYLGILAGRPQNILRLTLRVQSDEPGSAFLNVYWSMRPQRDPSHESERPQPSDVLLDAARHPLEFSRVLTNWLRRSPQWRDARLRFLGCFAKGGRYGIDRLVAAANMFDILPDSAVPPHVCLSDELKAAKESTNKIFRALPRSAERDSVLGELGRMGRSNLKHKIRHRARSVVDAVGDRFPDLVTVTDEAVDCRNYYVHGGDASFDYGRAPDTLPFFVDTLEFVFAPSDLIEANGTQTSGVRRRRR